MSKSTNVIRVKFTDFPGPFNPTRIERLLRQRFELVIDNGHPDYVIYSVTGHKHLLHPEAVRIFFTGENIRPDFNICDYAFAYDWMEFGDRYYRCPNYQLYDQFKLLCRSLRTAEPADDFSSDGLKFCNFVYTSPNGHPFRDQCFHRLNQYKRVDAPGAHLKNTDADIGPAYQGDWSASKVAFQSGYKFSFAFENSTTIGYTTEKIVHAMAAGSIPIYWGNPEIGREFNTRRFVNCHDYADADAIAQRIAEIDNNETEFRSMLREPFFPGNRAPENLQDEKILDQFDRIFDAPKQKAFRRNFHAWGLHYEQQRRAEVRALSLVEGKGILHRAARVLQRLV